MAKAMAPNRPLKKKYKRALILSGGGARGAYQIGVCKLLAELDWKPDLICGTSVGAINAVAIGCGFSMEDLIRVWQTIERRRIYRLSWWQQIKHFFLGKGFVPLMDTTPLKELLSEQFRFETLRTSKTEIIITAVNLLNSKLCFFNNRVIDIRHVMASGAIPILFPWQYIDGEPYWDGGVMMNTPLLPALERRVKEAIVVLLSPVGGASMDLPRSRMEAVEFAFEQQLIGSYGSFLAHINWNEYAGSMRNFLKSMLRPVIASDIKIATVAPTRMLGFNSILNFSTVQADTLIREGYSDAREQLEDFFNS